MVSQLQAATSSENASLLAFKALAPLVTTDPFIGQRLPCTSLVELHSLGG